MVIYYLLLPIHIIFSILSFLIVLLKFNKENKDAGLNCRSFNQIYYFTLPIDALDDITQKIKRSFLQKSWGITRYQDGMVKIDADYLDLAYATLGALKDLELGAMPDLFEQSVYGIIDNNFAIKSIEKTNVKYDLEATYGIFRPNAKLMPEQALSIIAALSLLAKSGNFEAKNLLNKLLWKNLYIVFLIFPNYISIELNSVCYFILNKTSTGFIKHLSTFYARVNKFLSFFKDEYFSFFLLGSLNDK